MRGGVGGGGGSVARDIDVLGRVNLWIKVVRVTDAAGLDRPVVVPDCGVEVGVGDGFVALVLGGRDERGWRGEVIVAGGGGDGAEVVEAVVLEVTWVGAGCQVAVAFGGVVARAGFDELGGG